MDLVYIIDKVRISHEGEVSVSDLHEKMFQ